MSVDQIILMAIALLNAFAAYMTYLSKIDVAAARADIAKVEIATNSMKDALVLSTGKENFNAGRDEGIATQKAREAIHAQGVREGEQTQQIPAPVVPVEVEVVKTTPVDIKQSVPLEIKEKSDA